MNELAPEQPTAAGLRELALFAGAGGGILGGHLLGWRTVCAVESEPYARDVLIARQDDGVLPPFPVWDDVRTFDGGPWRGRVDVVSGGFPCQDISEAGKGAGIDGERSGLWGHMARVVREVRPRFVFVENSPMLTSRGLGRVLGDLATLGFDAEWCVLGADDCGAPHRRKRIWILAHAAKLLGDGRDDDPGERLGGGPVPEPRDDGGEVHLPDAEGQRLEARRQPQRARASLAEPGGHLDIPHAGGSGHEGPRGGESDQPRPAQGGGLHGAWPVEPNVGRVAHGVAARVDRLRAIGNGQVPRVAAVAFNLLCARGGWTVA